MSINDKRNAVVNAVYQAVRAGKTADIGLSQLLMVCEAAKEMCEHRALRKRLETYMSAPNEAQKISADLAPEDVSRVAEQLQIWADSGSRPDEYLLKEWAHRLRVASGMDYRELYHELLFAVGKKWPNETRHQTALRYLKQAELGSNTAAQEANKKNIFPPNDPRSEL